MDQQSNEPKKKKKKLTKKQRTNRLIRWLIIDLTVAVILFGLLIYKPAQYNPGKYRTEETDNGRVHRYLTHELMETLYNKAQEGRPFELIIEQDLFNASISTTDWLQQQQAEGVNFTAPEVLFTPKGITVMGTANYEGIKFVITLLCKPSINEEKLLAVDLSTVKIGALNVTLLVKFIAPRMYKERLELLSLEGSDDFNLKIAAAMFNNQPFDPVFTVEDKTVRIENIETTEGKLIAHFVPVR